MEKCRNFAAQSPPCSVIKRAEGIRALNSKRVFLAGFYKRTMGYDLIVFLRTI